LQKGLTRHGSALFCLRFLICVAGARGLGTVPADIVTQKASPERPRMTPPAPPAPVTPAEVKSNLAFPWRHAILARRVTTGDASRIPRGLRLYCVPSGTLPSFRAACASMAPSYSARRPIQAPCHPRPVAHPRGCSADPARPGPLWRPIFSARLRFRALLSGPFALSSRLGMGSLGGAMAANRRIWCAARVGASGVL